MPTSLSPAPLVSLSDIRAAHTLIRPHVVRTPLVPFPLENFWLKPESLQPTGAFKLRGAFNAMLSLTPEERARGVVAHSSGNHAQAVAYAAQQLGIPAVVVMPDNAPHLKLDMTRAFGADVVIVGPASEERARRAEELSAERGLTPIPPYDDPRIIAGAGTVGLEILEDLPGTGTILVPVSGGGLISGVAAAVKLQRPGVRVIGVEPELAADAHESVRSGHRVTFSAEQVSRTLADGLRVQHLGDLNWAHVQAYVDDIITVSEAALRRAAREATLRTRLVTEPSGAVTIAAALDHRAALGETGPLVAILSGGNLDPGLLTELLTTGGA
ncbi:threonine/serine dehydratase (plasmid) [Deinococcus taeanensis]|uniref:threonine ammonia-lyase n=1 Tax=Deinococcus taeanensis TaxID=2737050 RepID=UPI001CDC3320|nr:threonine/serine dehydratase [Deinococcus taeanensis]UBV45326.1 threonine/serine dehydratase [Deinococcus taeanensis]